MNEPRSFHDCMSFIPRLYVVHPVDEACSSGACSIKKCRLFIVHPMDVCRSSLVCFRDFIPSLFLSGRRKTGLLGDALLVAYGSFVDEETNNEDSQGYAYETYLVAVFIDFLQQLFFGFDARYFGEVVPDGCKYCIPNTCT